MNIPAKLTPLTLGPADYNFMDPTGTLYTAASPASKTRSFDPCSNPLVANSTFQGSQIQYGTRPGDTPSSTTVTTNAGTLDALGSSDNLAGGRITRENGILTLRQYATDALVSSNPRCQMYAYPFQANQRIQFDLSVMFRTDGTPFPTYALNKDEIGFWEIKGPTTNPPINLVVDNWPVDTSRLRVRFFWKPYSGATTVVLCTLNDLDPNAWHDFFIDINTSYKTRGTTGPWIKFWYNGNPQTLNSTWTTQDITTVYRAPFNPDVTGSANYWQLKLAEIYRYEYSSAQAPDDCAFQWRRCAVYADAQRSASDFGDRTSVMTRKRITTARQVRT